MTTTKKKVWTASEMGKKGGPARKAALTPEELSRQALHAINTRWARVRAEQNKKSKKG